MKKKYLIFIDLDGTTLASRSVLTKNTVDMIKKMKENGHVFVIATGRPYFGAFEYYNKLGLDSYFISDNGASITNPKSKKFKPIFTKMDANSFYDSFAQVKNIIKTGIYNIEDRCYLYNYDKRLDYFFQYNPCRQKIEQDYRLIEDIPFGVIYAVEEDMRSDFEKSMNMFDKIGWRYWYDVKGLHLYEVFSKKVNKAYAVDRVIRLLEWDFDYTIAIGDNINDKEMVGAVRHGVAMKNCHNNLDEHAKYITDKTNDEDGMVDFLINKFKLLEV